MLEPGDHVRISKCKNIFPKGFRSNWRGEVSEVKKLKNTLSWTYIISDIKGDTIVAENKPERIQD